MPTGPVSALARTTREAARFASGGGEITKEPKTFFLFTSTVTRSPLTSTSTRCQPVPIPLFALSVAS